MKLEKLQSEMILAMKEKNKVKKDCLSNLIGAIKKEAIDKGCRDNITDEFANNVILKELKIAKEMLVNCPKSRTDLIEEYSLKIEIISSFAPKLITDEQEIELLIRNSFKLTKQNRGNIMKELKGTVDLSIANKILNRILK